MGQSQDSARLASERITQYISHGARCAGSEVRRALWDAKIGKRTVSMAVIVFGTMSKKNMAAEQKTR